MGYALFAQQKLVLYGLVNSIQLQQTQRSDAQMLLATKSSNVQRVVSTYQNDYYEANQEIYDLYDKLRSGLTSDERTSIQASIDAIQATIDTQIEPKIEELQKSINSISLKENVIEMEIKRLDTLLTVYQKRLDKVEEAETNGMEKATPHFKGMS